MSISIKPIGPALFCPRSTCSRKCLFLKNASNSLVSLSAIICQFGTKDKRIVTFETILLACDQTLLIKVNCKASLSKEYLSRIVSPSEEYLQPDSCINAFKCLSAVRLNNLSVFQIHVAFFQE